jgi:ESS family glutamate:Na+ symporter
MNFNWNFFLNGGIIATGLLLATAIRSKVRFFQRFLIPNSIIAGFLLLPMYNFVFPSFHMNTDALGELAYHLLSLSFISLTLRTPFKQKGRGKNISGTSMAILSQFGLQALIGLGLTWLMIRTFAPDLFHSFGLLLPLGYAQGPGQAFAIGEGWKVFGIDDAGTVGLTFAAVGFILASFGGIFLINYGVRHKWISQEYLDTIKGQGVRTGVYPKGSELPVGALQTTQTEAIDPLTINVVAVLFAYMLTFLFLKGLGVVLGLAGNAGTELATNLWGISFIFAALMGMLVRKILSFLKADHILDNRTLNRVSGLSVDLMVTSSIAAISLVIVARYWLPILIVSFIGGIMTLAVIPWMGSRVFTDHKFLRSLLVFGVSTGTLSTGLALLRVLDPEFETPVASDYTYASGMTFVLAIPFILSINFSAKAYQTGDMRWFAAALGVALAYTMGAFIWYMFLAKKKSFAGPSQVWFEEAE